MPVVVGLDTRFWSKVDGGGFADCWLWTAYIDSNGYGRFSVGGRRGGMKNAHRVAYELMVGDIPDGLELDHLCRIRHCVNPFHLEPVTSKENSIRSTAGEVNRRRQLSKTHCPKGHPYSRTNTGRRPDKRRRCLTCDALRSRAYRQNGVR